MKGLAQYSADLREDDSHILFSLIGDLQKNPDDLYLFKLIIENTKDPETLNPACSNSSTVLHIAAFNNILEGYKMIMDKIKDKNPSNGLGYTPLHFAARAGHFGICELIINNVENLNPRIKHGPYQEDTPLDWARRHSRKDVCKLIETAISKQNENVAN